MLEDVVLKPQTMKVKQVQGIENVATAVWFATLLLTYNPVYQISGGDLRRWYENIYSPLISQNHNL